ncbi:MAG: hypothetical protein JWN93_3359 [Hyphomicrobiales bacterium]|nr:hypothetical protein [Hyphomicrobiales bacterium]
MAVSIRKLFTRANSSATLLLIVTALFWGGNAPVARWAVGEISPMLIVCGRWALASLLMAAILPGDVLAQWRALLPHWRFLLVMGATLTASNALVFTAAVHTTGVNLSILQGVTPVLVMVGAYFAFATPIGIVRLAGLSLSILGVLLVATGGHLSTLGSLSLNVGDVFQIVAAVIYAGYALALRVRPPGSGWTLFSLLSVVSFVTSLPLLGWEVASGAVIWPTWKGFAALAYIAIFTSLLGQVFFMRAVELVGPARASMFQNLTPVIGAMLSVLLLGEALAPYHVAALALVIGGLVICERYGSR